MILTGTIAFVIGAIHSNYETKIIDCYDRQNHKILNVECESKNLFYDNPYYEKVASLGFGAVIWGVILSLFGGVIMGGLFDD